MPEKQPLTKTPGFPLLEVAAFVDSTTIVVVGFGVDELHEDEDLYIIGVGRALVPNIGVPLVAPKVKVEVTFAAGEYALARSLAEKREVPNAFAALATHSVFDTRIIERREPLTEDKSLFLGNPGGSKVKVGDRVIRVKDLPSFVRYIASVRDEDQPKQ